VRLWMNGFPFTMNFGGTDRRLDILWLDFSQIYPTSHYNTRPCYFLLSGLHFDSYIL
jgi:hypothetical protein